MGNGQQLPETAGGPGRAHLLRVKTDDERRDVDDLLSDTARRQGKTHVSEPLPQIHCLAQATPSSLFIHNSRRTGCDAGG